jgi:hypothetical protein
MIDKLRHDAPFWNKQTLWFFGLGVFGWILLVDALFHFVPWPTISPFLGGEWHWWGWILVIMIGIPLGFIASIAGFMLFAAFLSNMSAVSEFVPEYMASRSKANRGDPQWQKIYQRWQIVCFVWYIPWILAALSGINRRFE